MPVIPCKFMMDIQTNNNKSTNDSNGNNISNNDNDLTKFIKSGMNGNDNSDDDDIKINANNNTNNNNSNDSNSNSESNGNKKCKPFILITGTPGVGKTSLCEALSEETGLPHICVNDIVKDNKLYCGKDEQRDCLIIDEDKV